MVPADWDEHERNLHTVRLSDEASEPQTVTASAEARGSNSIRVRVDATWEHAGKTAVIRQGDHLLAQGMLLPDRVSKPQQAAAMMRFNAPPAAEAHNAVQVEIPGVESITMPLPACQQDSRATSQPAYRYIIQLPRDYGWDVKQRWPMILFLHGAAERGDDLNVTQRAPLPARMALRPDLPFIVVSPQCPRDSRWSTSGLNALLDEVTREYAVDPNRITLTGYSMGGSAAWNFAIEHPGRLAALVPICGTCEPADAGKIKDLPIWVFHGEDDHIVPIAESEKIVNALRKVKSRVRYTIYPGIAHEAWENAYDEEELYRWLLKQSRQ
jgi:predicted esterase